MGACEPLAIGLWPLATGASNRWTLNVEVEELNVANQESGLRDRLEIERLDDIWLGRRF